MVASMMIRGEAAVGLSIRGMDGRVIERADAILMAAQRRRLSPSLYERLWALRALLEKVAIRVDTRRKG
jgi:hypothetical protein